MIYVVIFILGGMFGAMMMALTVGGGTPDDDELEEKYWKDIEDYIQEENDDSEK